MEHGRADLGIGHLIGDANRAVKRRLGRDELRVLVHRSVAPAVRGRFDLAQLTNVPFLLWPRGAQSGVLRLLDGHLSATRTGRTTDPHRHLQNLGSWRYFLEDGRAFSLVPEDFARKEVGEGVAAYQLEPPAFLPLEVAWNKNASRTSCESWRSSWI